MNVDIERGRDRPGRDPRRSFHPRQGGDGRRRAPPLARPRRRLRDPRDRPRRAGRAALRAAAAARREDRARSSTSSSHAASGWTWTTTPISRRRSSASSRPIRCRGAWSRTCSGARAHFLTSDGLMVQHRDELRQSGGARRLGRAGRLPRAARRAAGLPAAHDPHAGRQLADGLHLVDRAGRAGQGDQRVQDAVERSRSRASPCCGPWPTSIPTIRSSGRCRRSTGAAATSGSSARSTARSTSTRSSPGAAATRSTTSSSISGPGSSSSRSIPRPRSR